VTHVERHRRPPRRDDWDSGCRRAIWSLAATLARKLRRQSSPDGFNVGVNVGAAGGQTIAHAHLHLIPRYAGDVADPRGGVRWIIPARASYWEG
jgi:diadenosine tetraphosphate (Ap4A) HIT family hydrolase